MEKSKLIPFLRSNLDILFIGLNPAKGSSDNGHYFSVNQAFWNQLNDAGLIAQYVDKAQADDIVFGDNKLNFNSWQFGITDLVTNIAESDSRKIKPTTEDCVKLKADIQKYKPKAVVFLHGIVLKKFLKHLGEPVPLANSGALGQLVEKCNTQFFNIGFPHGNSILSIDKVKHYIKLKNLLLEL